MLRQSRLLLAGIFSYEDKSRSRAGRWRAPVRMSIWFDELLDVELNSDKK